ncbi:response regulator [Saccharibacillus brassicae]|uniref:Response regulator n=1 Tax=Saccharibacillus brassicae TaxID=2583377 RepID=A0A4Y6UXC1_SACBS|nr:response regulator [Saccharibacillus brassicae]
MLVAADGYVRVPGKGLRNLRIYILDSDERSSLLTARMLEEYTDIDLLGCSGDASPGLQEVARLEPDAVFIDTKLGCISGLAASERLLREFPRLRVVYVTASREYAVEAFEQRAFDYLIKPLTRERLARTVVRLRHSCENALWRQED